MGRSRQEGISARDVTLKPGWKSHGVWYGRDDPRQLFSAPSSHPHQQSHGTQKPESQLPIDSQFPHGRLAAIHPPNSPAMAQITEVLQSYSLGLQVGRGMFR
jgi:hypothetical protein